jgi:hypothetical protein
LQVFFHSFAGVFALTAGPSTGGPGEQTSCGCRGEEARIRWLQPGRAPIRQVFRPHSLSSLPQAERTSLPGSPQLYRQPNGKYAVCFMLAGKPRFRTVERDLDAARREREQLAAAADAGALSVSPQRRFATVAGRWLSRFEQRVAAGERREQTLEAHRYYLDKHLLPALGRRLIRTTGVEDVAAFLTALRAKGCSEKTTAGALATLHSVLRFALRHGSALDDAVSKLAQRPVQHLRVLSQTALDART